MTAHLVFYCLRIDSQITNISVEENKYKMNIKFCAVAIIFALIGCIASENVPTDDQVIAMINNLDEEQSLPLFGGLSVEKVEGSDEASARSESLTDRIVRYLKSHKVNFEISEARSSVGGKIKPVIVKKVKSTLKEISK
jgi:hypothetical protein